jgi:RND family efflux transporter MFP subunit
MNTPKRKRPRWLLPTAILLVAVVVTYGLVATKPAPPKKDTPVSEPLVEVEPARPFAGEFLLIAQGSVAPRTQTTLVSEVNGAVVEVADQFNVGGFFRKGDLLLRIDPKDYQAALSRAQAQVANRQALLAQEQARADQARKDWDNLRRPGEPSDLVLRVPYVAEAQANLRSAQADLQQAQTNLSRTTIRAPYDGMLREKQVDVGRYVSTGTAVALLYAVDRAEVRLPLTEHDMSFVDLPEPGADAEGVALTLSADVGGERLSWPARMVRSENVIDERSRVVYAVAAVEDPYGVLGIRQGPPLPFGTFVDAQIPASIGHQVVGVPRHAVRGSNQLMTVDAEGRLRLREIAVVRSDTQHAFIDGGIEPGERVIVSTLEAPVDGMAVRVREDVAALAAAPVPGTAQADPDIAPETGDDADPDAARSGDGAIETDAEAPDEPARSEPADAGEE